MNESELRIVILISGGGTTMEKIVHETQEGTLRGKVKVAAVISDRSEAKGITKATSKGIKTFVIDKKPFLTREALGDVIVRICEEEEIDVILQNGWLSYTPENVVKEYPGRIFNQHPGPLDRDNKDIHGNPLHFGGKGMHGLAIHAAVLKFQELSHRTFPTEATIHCVTTEVDRGEVVYRAPVSVCPDDTAEILAERVLPHEHAGQIIFLHNLYNGRINPQKRNEPLIRNGEENLLYEAKKYGVDKYNRK